MTTLQTKLIRVILPIVSLVVATSAWGEGRIVRGREVSQTRDFNIWGTVGTVSKMDGYVQETTRALYDVTDQSFKQADAEGFAFNDFDMDGGFLTIGLSTEKAGPNFTFQFDLQAMNPSTDTVAQRNYYIDVGSVTFNDRTLKKMQIPKGTPFSVDIIGALIEMNVLWTPLTFKPTPAVRFTPLIGLGLFAFVGSYEIESGPSTGIILYQNPPEEFVVKGSADGTLGGGLPELVIGGELIIGERDRGNFVAQGTVGYFGYDGGTRYFTTSDRREKNADIDHLRTRVRMFYERALSSGKVLSIGAQYEMIDSEAFIQSKAQTREEILATRERFDKQVEFAMSTVTAFVGLVY